MLVHDDLRRRIGIVEEDSQSLGYKKGQTLRYEKELTYDARTTQILAVKKVDANSPKDCIFISPSGDVLDGTLEYLYRGFSPDGKIVLKVRFGEILSDDPESDMEDDF